MGITTENIQIVVTMDTKKAAENAKKFRADIDTTTKRLEAMKPNSKEFQAEMQKLIKSTEGFAKNSNFNTIKREYNAINKNVKNLTKGTKEWIIESAKADVLKQRLDIIRGKQKQYNKEIDKSVTAWSRLKKIGAGGATAIAAGIGLGLNSLKNFASESLDLYDKQAKAEAQLKSTLISTNQAAGRSYEQLVAQASELQGVTLFGDEDTIGAQSLLLTFTKVREEIFDRSIPAIQDMATAMGTDLKSASIQVGKALNDPLKGISALSRSGVSFDESQKKVIKTLVETGEVAKAQTIILEALEEQFGGSAQAAAEAGTGGVTQFQNSIGDVKEEIGELIQGPFKTGLKIGNEFLQFFVKFLQVLQQSPKFIRENYNLVILLGTAYALLKQQTIASTVATIKNTVAEKAAIVTKKAKTAAIAATSAVTATYSTVVGLATGRITLATLAQRALNFALKANPIGLVITALGILTAGFAKAYNSSERFRANIAGLKSLASETFSIIKESITSFLAGFDALKKGDVKGALKGFGDAFIKSNPVGIALTQGERLGQAFNDGYYEKLGEGNTGIDPENFIIPPPQQAQIKEAGAETGKGLTDGIIDGINQNTAAVVEEAKTLTEQIKAQIDQLRKDAAIEQNIEVKQNLLFKANNLERQLEEEAKKLEKIEFDLAVNFAINANPEETLEGIESQISFLQSSLSKTSDINLQLAIKTKIDNLTEAKEEAQNQINRVLGEAPEPVQFIQPIQATTVQTVEQQNANFDLGATEAAQKLQEEIQKIEQQSIEERLQIGRNYLIAKKAIDDNQLLTEEQRLIQRTLIETTYNTEIAALDRAEIDREIALRDELGLIDQEYFDLKNQLKEQETEKVIEENEKQKKSNEDLLAEQSKGAKKAAKALGAVSNALGEIADGYEEGTAAANFFTKASQAFAAAQATAAAAANLLAIAEQAKIPFPGNVIAISATVASVFTAVQKIKSLLGPSAEDGGVVYAKDGGMVQSGGTTYKVMPDVIYAENGTRFILPPKGPATKINEYDPIFAQKGAKFVVDDNGVRSIKNKAIEYKLDGRALEKNTGSLVYQVNRPSVYAEGGAKINKRAGISRLGQRHKRGGIKMFDGASGRYIGEWEKGEAYLIYSRNTVGKNKKVVDQLLYNSLHRNGANIFETNPEILPNAPRRATREDLSAATKSSSKNYFELGGVAGQPASALAQPSPAAPSSSSTAQNSSANMEKLLSQVLAQSAKTNQLLGMLPTNLKATVDLFQFEETLDELNQARNSDV